MNGDRAERPERDALLEGADMHMERNKALGDLPMYRQSSTASAVAQGQQACLSLITSWTSKKFLNGCVILFPMVVTFYIAWWFLNFFDGFFSPLYEATIGFHVFGLGFVTSMVFIFLVGVIVSSWIGASILWVGEWFIRRMPLIKHIYSASKQISQAISPENSTAAFKEVAIIRHPRVGEYAFAFITSTVTLQTPDGEEELYTVYVPTNHLYIGDIFLIRSADIIRPNLSVREGIEIVVSGGMAVPSLITPIEP
ncbi:COV-like protein [Klebsormidium nitens]|uniref:COV-like protein n=1 Tax=Klebsormidium nitens TaxID=105231 RepID=A0A1Y1ISG3_KLENI|nr:COV-like protein [Klebsormidium nitens]|eukprot:GAQ92469.1 COV-like protein [Klebsormidium nitens]